MTKQKEKQTVIALFIPVSFLDLYSSISLMFLSRNFVYMRNVMKSDTVIYDYRSLSLETDKQMKGFASR